MVMKSPSLQFFFFLGGIETGLFCVIWGFVFFFLFLLLDTHKITRNQGESEFVVW